jgi:hypothetical protein
LARKHALEFFRGESKMRQWSAFVRGLSAQIPPFERDIIAPSGVTRLRRCHGNLMKTD